LSDPSERTQKLLSNKSKELKPRGPPTKQRHIPVRGKNRRTGRGTAEKSLTAADPMGPSGKVEVRKKKKGTGEPGCKRPKRKKKLKKVESCGRSGSLIKKRKDGSQKGPRFKTRREV